MRAVLDEHIGSYEVGRSVRKQHGIQEVDNGEVKEWVAANIERFRRDKPEWFKVEKIPDEYLPVEVLVAEGGAKRRRSSVSIREVIGLDTNKSKLTTSNSSPPPCSSASAACAGSWPTPGIERTDGFRSLVRQNRNSALPLSEGECIFAASHECDVMGGEVGEFGCGAGELDMKRTQTSFNTLLGTTSLILHQFTASCPPSPPIPQLQQRPWPQTNQKALIPPSAPMTRNPTCSLVKNEEENPKAGKGASDGQKRLHPIRSTDVSRRDLVRHQTDHGAEHEVEGAHRQGEANRVESPVLLHPVL